MPFRRRWFGHTGALAWAIVSAVAATSAGGAPVITEVAQREVPQWTYSYVSGTTTGATLEKTLAELTPRVIDAMQHKGLKPAGMFVYTFHGATPDPQKKYVVDVGVPVEPGQAIPAGIQHITVPAVRCASVVMTGKSADLPLAYAKLYGTIGQLQLSATDVNRQIVHKWVGADSDKNVIEVQAELKAAAPVAENLDEKVVAKPNDKGGGASQAPVETSPSPNIDTVPRKSPPATNVRPTTAQAAKATSRPIATRAPSTVQSPTSTDPLLTRALQDLLLKRHNLFDVADAAGAEATPQGLREYAALKAAYSAEIRNARDAYWRAYPDDANLPALATAYCQALSKKAWFYHEMGMGRAVFGQGDAGKILDLADRATGGDVDGGYDVSVRGDFQEWSRKVGIAPNPMHTETFAGMDALLESTDEWANFCAAEVRHEFLAFSRTSPLRSDDPLTRFIGVAVEHSQGLYPTFSKGRQLGETLLPILGKQTLGAAADYVLKSREWINLQTGLSEVASQSEDDHVFGLWLLAPQNGDPLTAWKSAEKTWTELAARAGEAKLKASVGGLRVAHAGKVLGLRRLYRELGVERAASEPESPMFPLIDFADLGGAPWNCLVSDENGRLFGLRVKSDDTPSAAFDRGAASQRNAQAPWSPLSNKEKAWPISDALEVVSFDNRTGSTRILATITADMLAQLGLPKIGARPGSMLLHHDWIYATEASTGAAFRVHTDGSDFAFLRVPRGTGERTTFCGINHLGEVVGETGHQIFSLAENGLDSRTLASDAVNWLCFGAIASDGTIYFQKFLAKPIAGKPYQFMMTQTPSGKITEIPGPDIPAGQKFSRYLTAGPKGEIYGMTDGETFAAFDGKSWSVRRIGPSPHPFLSSPMTPSGNFLFSTCVYEPDSSDCLVLLYGVAINGKAEQDVTLMSTMSSTFKPIPTLVRWEEEMLVGVSSKGGRENLGFLYVVDPTIAQVGNLKRRRLSR